MKTNAKIYVMRADDGTLKLGHSIDPARRSKNVGRSVEVVYETDVVEQAERIERLAHKVLALHGKHLHGEWFEATLGAAILSIDIAIRQAERQEFAMGGRLNHSIPPAVFVRRFEMRSNKEFVDAVAIIQKASVGPRSHLASDVVRQAVLEEAERVSQKGQG